MTKPSIPKSPWVVAITGAIGSGKSCASKMLSDKGLPLIDADILARQVVVRGSEGLSEVVKEFGKEVLNPDESLNRSYLAKIVFSDDKKRKKLESILHPRIRALFRERLTEYTNGPILYAVPLYYESEGSYPEVKRVIVIYAPLHLCLERIKKRDNLTEQEAARRTASQLPIEEKRAKADYVIDNTGTLEALLTEITKAYSWIMKEYEQDGFV